MMSGIVADESVSQPTNTFDAGGVIPVPSLTVIVAPTYVDTDATEPVPQFTL